MALYVHHIYWQSCLTTTPKNEKRGVTTFATSGKTRLAAEFSARREFMKSWDHDRLIVMVSEELDDTFLHAKK